MPVIFSMILVSISFFSLIIFNYSLFLNSNLFIDIIFSFISFSFFKLIPSIILFNLIFSLIEFCNNVLFSILNNINFSLIIYNYSSFFDIISLISVFKIYIS